MCCEGCGANVGLVSGFLCCVHCSSTVWHLTSVVLALGSIWLSTQTHCNLSAKQSAVPKPLPCFVPRSCSPFVRDFGVLAVMECLAMPLEVWGRKMQLQKLWVLQRVNLHRWLHDSPQLSVPSLQHFFPLFHQSNRHGFNFP